MELSHLPIEVLRFQYGTDMNTSPTLAVSLALILFSCSATAMADGSPEILQNTSLINAKHNITINPEFNSAINPEHNSSIDPKSNSSINPNANSAINPTHNSSINPKYESSINPQHALTLNPQHNESLSPKGRSWSGFYHFNLQAQAIGAVVRADSENLVYFDDELSWAGYFSANSEGGFNWFTRDGEWIGFLVNNGEQGFNLFDNQGKWIGFLTQSAVFKEKS